jgi:hypothetical protein
MSTESFINYLSTVQNNGSSISCFNPQLVNDIDQTDYQELCLAAVKNTSTALQEILFDQVTDANAIITEALKNHDVALHYLPQQYKTADIYIQAVSFKPLALLLVPVEFQTKEMCEDAVKAKPFVAKYVKFSEKPKVCTSADFIEMLTTKCFDKVTTYASFDLDEATVNQFVDAYPELNKQKIYTHIGYIIPRMTDSTLLIKKAYSDCKVFQMICLINVINDCGIDLNKPLENGMRPIHYACKENISTALVDLLTRGALANIPDDNGMYPLHYAALNMNNNDVRRVLERLTDRNPKDKDGNTPLHLVFQHDKTDDRFPMVIETLLAEGCGLNETNNAGETPLQILCDYKNGVLPFHEIIIRQCLKYSSIQKVDGNALINGALSYACYNYNTELVKLILKCAKDYPTVTSIKDMILLDKIFNETEQMLSVPISKRVEMATILIEAGIPIDQVIDGRTSLHYACMENELELVKYLVDSGANKELVDDDNKKPVHYAINNRNMDIIKLLI